ncbi:hypothetical protein FSP39_012746 [Pinctada imbricata]|uniref:G-protein coupled receptors family 1 profile domain-containing protein n=1 Tax=Pinctada imbricata TaxID=66713 RepID=A0AA88XRY8_PINIB|nr:hypothetical protein FSP39_012746 [Pinctada imbricata]
MASGNMSLYRNHSISGDLSDQALSGLMILYIVTTFLSLIGNTLVVVVFVKGRRSRTDLRYFLINLAVSDLIMAAFCMPFTFADSILREWVFSPPMCPLVLFMQLLSVCGSVFTNMAIGIDRFMAVTFPLHSRITYRRGKYVIVIVWICSLSLASVQLFIGEAREDAPNKYECNEYWPDNRSRRIYTIFLMLMTYLLPLVILLVTYTIVGIILWRRTAPGNKHHVRDLHQLKSKIKHGPGMHVSGTQPSSVILNLNNVIWPKEDKNYYVKNVPKDVAEWVGYDATGPTF